MKHLFTMGIFLSIFCTLSAFSQSVTSHTLQIGVDHIVISEFATQGPSSSQDEFLELYNPTENDISLRDWKVEYKASAATSWSDRAILPANAIIPAHGFYLITNTNYVGATPPDYTSSLWSATTPISSVGHLRIVDESGIEIDKVGYGSIAIDPEGSPAPNQTQSNQSVERKAFAISTAESLASGGRHFLEGNGYDSDNNANDFVLQTHGRQPQNSQTVPEPAFGIGGNGTGKITVTPNRVFNNWNVSLSFTIRGDSGYTLNVIKFIVPSSWSWSHETSSIVLTGAAFDTAMKAIAGDTIIITRAAVTSTDTGSIHLTNMISPLIGGPSVFRFFTGVSGGTPAQILAQPSVKVNAVVPIVTVHVNTSQGVPTTPYGIGAEVTVTGTVTANLSGVQTNVFIQDATAGINLFSFSRPIDFQLGDSVIITGTIMQFRGLTEVGPDFVMLTIISQGRPLPEPLIMTCADVNATFQPDYSEPNEGRLIRINGVSYNSVTSTITDASGTTNIFIPSSFPPTPSVFDVIGILKQFKPGTSPPPPYTQDYEIQPRFPADIIGHPGPVITQSPFEDEIQASSVRINWATDVASSSVVYYGPTTAYRDSGIDLTPTTSHSVLLTGLSPATFYYYAVGSGDSNGTTVIGDFLMSTASPPGTTGQINVYFNRSVDTSVSSGERALSNQDLTSRLVERINNARRSIDACLYSLSSTPGNEVANALVSAKNRGVRVRVICENENSSSAAFSTITSNGIPLITDLFDTFNGGVGLQHNKFVVIDAYGGAPESVWVWTGSWNPTGQGTFDDRQNAIEIQDVALAKAYTAEFEEMWGSSTSTPNSSTTRFGAHKTNNTPHRFNVNGVPIESYFSPSDRTTSQIGKTLSRAQLSVGMAMLIFTRRDLADSLIAVKNRGKKVRVVMDTNTGTGNQYSYLQSSGIDAHLKGFSDGLLHHKYAIVDATQSGGTQWVITGSHNWTTSAENANDENILIIQDNRIANLYLQEFAARYVEAGGSDPIVLGVREIGVGVPNEYSLSQNYPNPFNPSTNVRFEVAGVGFVSLKVYDVLGREVATLVHEELKPGTYEVTWDASQFASGVYFYQIRAGNFTAFKKALLLR
ncbi:MAG: lamin tail domain-containing protein [Ignavibacteriae bacterium]|nr:lamin tail domain-containing protein [Ignavibacteriota bacterium]